MTEDNLVRTPNLIDFDTTFRDIPNKINVDERSPSRFAATSTPRHRVGASPVRVKRSINESVPTAVVTPTPPSKPTLGDIPNLDFIKTRGHTSDSRRVSFYEMRLGVDPSLDNAVGADDVFEPFPHVNSTPLSRRSRSSVGSIGLGLVTPTKLEHAELSMRQQDRSQRRSRIFDRQDVETQVPSNSILTLHSLLDDNRTPFAAPRDDSQDRRLKEMEARIHEIERLIARDSTNRRDLIINAYHLSSTSKIDSTKSLTTGGFQAPNETRPIVTSKATSSPGIISVSVPPMIAMDGGVFRVQPTSRSESKAQREVERLEKKIKQQEEVAETFRTQHHKQIEQLTRQLASNDDVIQTLRSRIRELELENELWQNRFRIHNDVDVAKLLQDNERLRQRLRKYSAKYEQNDVDIQAKEQLQDENKQLVARVKHFEEKYRLLKDKYKEAVKEFRLRYRQDHVELESLKVMADLQNSELIELREQVKNQPITIVQESNESAFPDHRDQPLNVDFINYNVSKCNDIVDCLSKVCVRIKRKAPVDPTELLEYGIDGTNRVFKRKDEGDEKPLHESIDQLTSKLTDLHSKVIDLYGDELARVVASSCNVQ